MTSDEPSRPAEPTEHVADGIPYHSMPGVDGRFFRCELYQATLRASECRKRFERAQIAAGEALNPVIRCRTCPIGAAHAGRPTSYFSPLYGSMICPRCHKGATRMIGSRVCVSCYNRARELAKGRNSKGTAPVKLQGLARRTLLVRTDDGRVCEHTLDQSADMLEVMADALRKVPGRLMFAFNRPLPWLEPRNSNETESPSG